MSKLSAPGGAYTHWHMHARVCTSTHRPTRSISDTCHRAARFCHSAAHGGQIMLPLSLAESLVEEWTGSKLDLAAGTRMAAQDVALSKHLKSVSLEASAAAASKELFTRQPKDVVRLDDSPAQVRAGGPFGRH